MGESAGTSVMIRNEALQGDFVGATRMGIIAGLTTAAGTSWSTFAHAVVHDFQHRCDNETVSCEWGAALSASLVVTFVTTIGIYVVGQTKRFELCR
tara:strand:+ start:153 stop:440 length:288 start_codon:yes stop_codon:yes gene_type:complete